MRVKLFDLPVDILTRDETVAQILSAIANRQRCQHVAVNVAKLVNARSNAELDGDVRNADIIGIDGMGILFALRLLGYEVAERVAGVDLFETLMGECARRGLKPFLLGATPEVLAGAEHALLARYPGLVFAGSRDGYFTPAEEANVCAQIRLSRADCLFVAMPTPRKERFMRRHRDDLGVPFVMGIGGTLDVVAGHVRRAPAAVQRVGLEWAYRMAQEPRRLGARYLYTNLIFSGLLVRPLLARLGRSLLGRGRGSAKAQDVRLTLSDPQ